MNIQVTQVTKHLLSGLPRLDPVTVIMEDFGAGKGKLYIDCYGKAWTAYWGAIGDQNIQSFIKSCDVHYIAGKLSGISSKVTDYDAISDKLGFCVDRESLWMCSKDMSAAYGPDWYMDLPQTENPDYEYLCRIVKAVKEFASAKEPA